MEQIVYRFDEVVTDGYNSLLLGDLICLKNYQTEHSLGENLQVPFTESESGDDVVKSGTAIYLGGVQNPYNEGYSVFFNFTDVSEIANTHDSRVIHNVPGYLLSVISNRICLYTWPYLRKFNEETVEGIYSLCESAEYKEQQSITGNKILQGNAFRQSVPLDNGYYEVAVICGYVDEDVPALEFLFKPTEKSAATDLNFLLSYNYSI